MRKLILFLAAVSLVLFAEKALCYETTFSIGPESFNSFRYQEMRAEEAAPLSIRTGRFLSVDPTWESADLGKPQTWNRYTYVTNNPVNLTDPDGKCPTCIDVVLDLLSGDTGPFEKGYDPAVSDNPPRSQAEFDQRVRDGRSVRTEADRPYQRPSGATTPQQRASVQNKPCEVCGKDDGGKRVAGHKKALVQEHYETGTIDKKKMRSLDAVRPECPTCSAREGAAMSRYSRAKKEALEFLKKLLL